MTGDIAVLNGFLPVVKIHAVPQVWQIGTICFMKFQCIFVSNIFICVIICFIRLRGNFFRWFRFRRGCGACRGSGARRGPWSGGRPKGRADGGCWSRRCRRRGKRERKKILLRALEDKKANYQDEKHSQKYIGFFHGSITSYSEITCGQLSIFHVSFFIYLAVV